MSTTPRDDDTPTKTPAMSQQEAAKRLVEAFVNGSDDTRQRIADAHGDCARARGRR